MLSRRWAGAPTNPGSCYIGVVLAFLLTITPSACQIRNTWLPYEGVDQQQLSCRADPDLISLPRSWHLPSRSLWDPFLLEPLRCCHNQGLKHPSCRCGLIMRWKLYKFKELLSISASLPLYIYMVGDCFCFFRMEAYGETYYKCC